MVNFALFRELLDLVKLKNETEKAFEYCSVSLGINGELTALGKILDGEIKSRLYSIVNSYKQSSFGDEKLNGAKTKRK